MQVSLPPCPARRPRPWRRAAPLLAVVLVPAGCSASQPGGVLSGSTLDGDELDTADLRGGLVALNERGSWCAPCHAEAPELPGGQGSVRFVELPRFAASQLRADPSGPGGTTPVPGPEGPA